MGDETAFTADGIPLAQVTPSKYIGTIITTDDNDWPAAVSNLWKSRHKWAHLTRVLGREGGRFPDLVTDILGGGPVGNALQVSEVWVVTPLIGWVLGRFHHRVARRLTGRQPWRGKYGVWKYLPL